MSSLLSLVTIDLGPLRRHRQFRLFFAGQALSFLGSMITYVAVPYQTYQLTGSTFVVGLVSFAELVPLVAGSLAGGALADAFDRRRLVIASELALALCAGVLVVNALLPDPQLWVLFVVAAAISGLTGIQRPPLQAMVPRLVERGELAAAGALDSFRWTVGLIAGPAVGGLLIAAAGLPLTYAANVLTFAISLGALALMRPVPAPEGAERPSLRGITEGVRFAARRQVLVGTYTVDMIAMFFGMPTALFPAMADNFGGARALGLLYAAPAVGALAASLTSGWVSRIHRQGLAVIFAAAGWGIAIIGLGFAPGLGLALAALVAAGAADMVSMIFRGVIWNVTIPDELRGRLAGIEQISYSSGPLLGNLESGVVAALFGLRASIVSGGILCVAGVAAAALALPAFRRYDARSTAEPARAEASLAAAPAE